MSGVRVVTTGLGILERTPPDAVAEQTVPGMLARLSPERRATAVELAHWGYGAVAGALFGLLPRGFRRARLGGPAYGTAVWLGFELVISPALGATHVRRHPVAGRAAVALDHLLYGVVVASGERR